MKRNFLSFFCIICPPFLRIQDRDWLTVNRVGSVNINEEVKAGVLSLLKTLLKSTFMKAPLRHAGTVPSVSLCPCLC